MMKSRVMVTSLVAFGAAMILMGEVSAQQTDRQGMANSYQIQELLAYKSYSLTLPSEPGQPFTANVQLGESVQSLDLHPYSMLAEDFQVLVPGENGTLVPTEIPALTTYRGSVRGDDGSVIAASLIEGQLWASIVSGDGEYWVVQPATGMGVANAARDIHIVYKAEDVAPHDGICGVTEEPKPIKDENNGGSPLAGTGYFMTDIALDADFEFYQLNGSSVALTVADMLLVMNNMEAIYEDNPNGANPLDISYEITTIIVRTNINDPYSSTDPITLINQMAAAWNSAPEVQIRRDMAELFTGKNINGGVIGIASLGTVCNLSNAYSVVQSRFSSNLTLRGALTAHELGHNWNSGHCSGGGCHIMCPNINSCGGVIGSNYEFGTSATNAIVNFRNSRSCLFDLPLPLDPPFFEDFPFFLLNTDNWIYNFGGIISAASSNPPSTGKAINLDGGGGQYAKDELRSNFINLQGESDMVFSYYTEHIGVEAGESLIVEYWITASNGQWVEINEVVSDGVNQSNFELHSHDLPANAYHSEFRFRFRTQVNGSTDDWYIDDISVTAELPCPTDLNGDGTVGTIDLLTLLGAWGPNPGNPADFDGDGSVGTIDLLILLGAWGPCP